MKTSLSVGGGVPHLGVKSSAFRFKTRNPNMKIMYGI
tara:strand:+ start:420 stop:530 length:111 start_codon:yes stop_codon:yes gene_type:complete